jgi:HD superfamily phosphohydrolase
VKANKKAIRVISIVLVAICIILWYFYLTRPVGLYDVINNSAIKRIHILTDTSSRITNKLPGDLKLENEQDINTIIDILNEYKYSKILKFYNTRIASANPTNGVINIFISYTNADGEFRQQYIFVDTENDVVIRNKNGVNIEYRISGRDKELFENLSSWLRLKQ